jgi:hypothetical protein
MAERKVIIGRCATTTLPKICDICGIYGFLSRHNYIFAGRVGLPLAETGMRHLLARLTGDPTFKVHGFRGCFFNWAGDETSADEETREFCLAHVKRGVAGHYRSTTAVTKRRILLQGWADFIATGVVPEHLQVPKADVIPLRRVA